MLKFINSIKEYRKNYLHALLLGRSIQILFRKDVVHHITVYECFYCHGIYFEPDNIHIIKDDYQCDVCVDEEYNSIHDPMDRDRDFWIKHHRTISQEVKL